MCCDLLISCILLMVSVILGWGIFLLDMVGVGGLMFCTLGGVVCHCGGFGGSPGSNCWQESTVGFVVGVSLGEITLSLMLGFCFQNV